MTSQNPFLKLGSIISDQTALTPPMKLSPKISKDIAFLNNSEEKYSKDAIGLNDIVGLGR